MHFSPAYYILAGLKNNNNIEKIIWSYKTVKITSQMDPLLCLEFCLRV